MNTKEYNDAKLFDRIERLPRMKGESSIIEAAERQMQRWLLVQQGRDKVALASNAGAAAAIGP